MTRIRKLLKLINHLWNHTAPAQAEGGCSCMVAEPTRPDMNVGAKTGQ